MLRICSGGVRADRTDILLKRLAEHRPDKGYTVIPPFGRFSKNVQSVGDELVTEFVQILVQVTVDECSKFVFGHLFNVFGGAFEDGADLHLLIELRDTVPVFFFQGVVGDTIFVNLFVQGGIISVEPCGNDGRG